MVLIATATLSDIPTVRACFRPLTGIVVLITIAARTMSAGCRAVSVPLRGLWFLSFGYVSVFRRAWTRFRPLTGIVVLIRRNGPTRNIFVSFRPLTGIVVLIGKSGYCLLEQGKVSVPLRGLWFLSDKIPFDDRIKWVLFPSPYGDCGSYPLTNILST